ncbi:MAG: hypothetical protein PWQ82_974 [Thermosediminibacterales bacterium]|nr:hypothetical protein [Thermosediminibacterales bacterium]MDK2835828.1 hypothetical protein [Thermosediminibacterales bacterium]
MAKSLETELFCLDCDKETVHEVTYVGNYLKCIRCSECGRTTSINRQKLLKHFTADVIERLITKPHRITEELRNDMQRCIHTLPARIITKPFRAMKEISEILRD